MEGMGTEASSGERREGRLAATMTWAGLSARQGLEYVSVGQELPEVTEARGQRFWYDVSDLADPTKRENQLMTATTDRDVVRGGVVLLESGVCQRGAT